jgi:hypothetical protein
MKKHYLIILFRIVGVLTMVFGIVTISYSQVDPNNAAYDQLKRSDQLPQMEQALYTGEYPAIDEAMNPNRAGLLVPLDGSFTLAMGRNDDLSSGLISIPFPFCLYGTNHTSFYINNNGNISFGSPYWQYTPWGFPVSGYPMVAPFFADVDTRNTSSGLVYYKIDPVVNRVTIIWDQVGYYNYHADRLCTFELILTDGMDPLIGIGNNVAFCYDDMDWTTGDASGGSGGFGGIPATVGINKGDGVSFAQVGRFDHPGADYDGPGGAVDGVDYLDGRTFFFSTCSFVNIPPSPTGFPAGPVSIDVGDVYTLSVQFLSPEVDQVTTTAVDAGTLSDFSYTSTPGNVSTVDMQLTGTCDNVGTHTIQFTATDNGDPVETTTVNLVITVDDIIYPEITCPADITYNCVEDVPALDPEAATATDNCSYELSVVETSNGGAGCMTDPLILNRTFTAVDIGGNSVSCTQVITVATQPLTFTATMMCDADMSAYWDCTDPNCVEVSASKELSNVVLMDCDGTHYKFDELYQGYSGTFCHPSGLPVATVWIKAGCFKSGDGPGYGRRFDAPCNYCPPMKNMPADQANISPEIYLYPNPARDEFSLVVFSENLSAVDMGIYDLRGKKVLEVLDVRTNTSFTVSEELPAGIYLIRIENNRTSPPVKLIKY